MHSEVRTYMQEKIKSAISGKRVLITGGTGSFGHAIVRALIAFQPAEITIMSRDEKKQHDMQQSELGKEGLRFVVGDVRDLNRLRQATRGQNLVYHAAALKQVPNCEFAPYEAVRTNVIGAENVRMAAVEADVEAVVAISTDKAVKPVNAMGISKAMQEKLILQPTLGGSDTRFLCVRYGNVLGSRGSVVPFFLGQISRGEPLSITHPGMTRFQLLLSEAVELVLWATVHGKNGQLWVRKMPAANVVDLANALAASVTGRDDYPTRVVGIRPGEKIHEVLVSEEEMWRAEEFDDHFLVPAWREGAGRDGPKSGQIREYTSNSVEQLTIAEIVDLLTRGGCLPGERPVDGV